MKKVILGIAFLTLLVGASMPAQAGFMTFFGIDNSPGGTVPAGGLANTARNNFLSNLSGGVGTEDFESFANGTPTPINLSFPGSSGAITATLTGSAQVRNLPVGGRYATSGNNYLDTSTGGGFTIEFSSAISAFGFFGTDIGDIGGNLVLGLTNGDNKIINLNTGGRPNGSLMFWGFTDDMNAYDRITFTNTSTGDAFGFDDMTVGDAGQVTGVVPEPGSMTIFAALGCFGLIARRHRS